MRKVFYNNIFAHLLLWRKGFDTAMLFGFICTKGKDRLSASTVNHESIHAEQYAETTALGFGIAFICSVAFGWAVWPFVLAVVLYYIIYFVETAVSWVYNFFLPRKKNSAGTVYRTYYNSVFEHEAYSHETNMRYIKQRKPFCWVKYFGKA